MSKFQLKWQLTAAIRSVLWLGCMQSAFFMSAQLQAPGYEIRRISFQNGLGNQVITSLVNDRNTLVWIGTQNGLYRFDGTQVLRIGNNYTTPANQRGQYITDLAIDAEAKGMIFVCSALGARILDPISNTFVQPSTVGIPDTLFQGFTQIEPVGNGIFYGLQRQSIYRIKRTTYGQYVCEPWCYNPAPLPLNMVVDPAHSDGVWLLGANHEVWHVSKDSMQHFFMPVGQTPILGYGHLQMIFHKGSIYCWDIAQNIFRFDEHADQFKCLDKSFNLYNLMPDLFAVDYAMKRRVTVNCMVKLDIQQIAFGTSLGLFLVRKKATGFNTLEAMREVEIRGIHIEENGQWTIGSYSGMFTGKLGEPKVNKFPKLKIVWGFLPIRKNLWILGFENNHGLQLWDPVTETLVDSTFTDRMPNPTDLRSVLSVTEDVFGTKWVGTFLGLVKNTPDSPFIFRQYLDPQTSIPFTHPNIRTLHCDRDSNIWIGAEDGLFRIRHNPKQKQYQLITPNSIAGKVPISHIYEDRYGNLWLASKGMGLGLLERGHGQISWFNTDDGLCNDLACRIESSHGDSVLWISTHNGLSRFDVNSKAFHNFYEEQGFPGNEFNSGASARHTDGTLFFGGVNGLIYFHPDSIFVSNFRYNTWVPYVQVYNNKVESQITLNQLSDGLRFEPYPELIELVLSSNELTLPGKIRFRYRMIGLSDKWNISYGENKAKYVRLPPGTYEFQAQAIPLDGHFGEIFSLSVFIATPFYETWWFRMLVIATILLMCYGAYRFRLRQIMKEQLIRQQVADDLHDDIGNKLNIISIIAQKVSGFVRKNSLQLPKDNSLEKLIELSKETQISLTTMIWTVDPSKDSVANLIARMQDFADDFVRPIMPQFTFYAPETVPNLNLNLRVRHHLMLIYQEILVNMIKHTHSSRISVELHLNADKIILTITNQHEPNPHQPFDTVSGNRGKNTLNRRLREINGFIEYQETEDAVQKTTVLIPQVFNKS